MLKVEDGRWRRNRRQLSSKPTKTSLPSSTQQNPPNPEHLMTMPVSLADTSTACAHSKCQTSRPKWVLLHATKSGFGQVALSSPARGGLPLSISSVPEKSAAQCRQSLSEFTQERTLTLTADPVGTGHNQPVAGRLPTDSYMRITDRSSASHLVRVRLIAARFRCGLKRQLVHLDS